MLDEHGQQVKGITLMRVLRSWDGKVPSDPVPPCFPSVASFLGWIRSWNSAGGLRQKSRENFCTDCTPDRQSAMIRARRCLYPGTTFDHDEDHFVRGLRP